MPVVPADAEIEVPSYTKGIKPVEGSELRSSVKSEVAVLDSPYLIVRTVSVSIK